MKYTTEIVINKPIGRVIELFDNPKYYKNSAGSQFWLISKKILN